MSEPSPESVPTQATDIHSEPPQAPISLDTTDTATVHPAPELEDESAVVRITDPSERNGGAFRPVYTGFDQEFEVVVLKNVPDCNSIFDGGHCLIMRPEWERPRKALPENVDVRTEADFR